jgi:hypothetical protein
MIRDRRKPCPDSCDCLCHDLNGGPVHPGRACPGKDEPTDDEAFLAGELNG